MASLLIAKVNEMKLSKSASIACAVDKPEKAMVIYHTRAGTYINTKGKPIDVIKKIQRYFTISNKTIMGYMEYTSAWRYVGSRLYIPRFGSLFLTNKFDDVTYINQITRDNGLPNMTYTGGLANDNQRIIYSKIMNEMFNEDNERAGKAGLILDLQAGQGKTFLAMYIISKLKCRTLVVTHNKGMMNQWYDLLKSMFVNSTIGRYFSDKKELADIVVSVINSISKDTIKVKGFDGSTREFFDKFDLVIFDESHIYCTKTLSKIYQVAQSPYMLGLSATPNERTDGLDKVTHWNVGPILVAEDIEDFDKSENNFTGRVHKIMYSGPKEYTETILNEKLELVSVPLMIKQLSEDPYRLQLIVNLILEHHTNNLNILVFTDNRKYLEDIRKSLDQAKLESITLEDKEEEEMRNRPIDSIRLVGGSSTKEFELARNEKNIILSTYQYMSTGVSISKLNAIVLATPRKNKSRQIINRVFRLGSDETIERQIIDIVDVKISLKNQWYTRASYYKSQTFTIEEKKYSWQDITV